ncbi:MAG: DUF3050 domain-containing protein [Bacteriovoracaceae bacterium]|nr:DUF3050 domain-containing protein [Bacteriovoracaceae bacterium]
MQEINEKQTKLANHPLYSDIKSIEELKIFMKWHVFAVWDFMSLLKSLQRQITSIELPWMESNYSPELVRLINEIVLGEESDVDFNGRPSSHFALYLEAMEEIGADTQPIKSFLSELDFNLLPEQISEIVTYHLELANNGQVHEVASSFFYGREKLIPEMFTSIVNILKENNLHCPTLIYYFERHIELDGEEHGPMALKCLDQLGNSKTKISQINSVALESLEVRNKLWNFIHEQIQKAAD